MTDTDQTPGDNLTQLSDVLNRLAGRQVLTISEVAGERQKLADIATNFNGASFPAAEKLAAALPDIKDTGSRWITAKMLRDAGLKDETQGEFALTALSAALANEKDAGSRYMMAALIRDLGVKHEGLVIPATVAISTALTQEKDPYAKNAVKNSLMSLGTTREAAAAIAVAGLGKALQEEKDAYTRILFAHDLRDLGLKWPSQASAVLNNLSKAAAKEKDTPAIRHIAQDIADVTRSSPSIVPQAITALTDGLKRETKSEPIFAYSHALMLVGQSHPLAVIAAIDQDFEGFKDHAHKDQRRASICNLSALAGIGKPESEACAKVLLNALKDEKEPFHRRLILSGLTVCIQNRVDTAEIKQALIEKLPAEDDRETREQLQRMLRSMNYVPPSNVVQMPFLKT